MCTPVLTGKVEGQVQIESNMYYTVYMVSN